MKNEDLCFTPATELAEAVRTKKLSPVEITQTFLERIEAVNPKINAFCTLTPDLAMTEAREAEDAVMKGRDLGPLHGVPYSVKDLILTQGIKTMRGSKLYENDVPVEDAVVYERLRKAGGIMLGKTATPEFGHRGSTDSKVSGMTRNPWNTAMTSGGSSGGASAQVAAGLGPLAVGTDGGGSVRIPAAFTGIFGHKPSFGRVPLYPASAHDHLANIGPMTRTVGDGALMLGVMAGPDDRDRFSLEAAPEDYLGELEKGIKGLRVAWSADLGFAKVDPEVAKVAGEAAKVFKGLGCHFEEINPGFSDPSDIWWTLWNTAMAGYLGHYLPEREGDMDPVLVAMIKQGMKISAAELTRAQLARHDVYEAMRALFDNYDLLLTPTVAVLPFDVGHVVPPASIDQPNPLLAWAPFTSPINLTMNPAASVPAGFSASGLPVGLHIIGKRFQDGTVLRAARAFENAQPWAEKKPSLV